VEQARPEESTPQQPGAIPIEHMDEVHVVPLSDKAVKERISNPSRDKKHQNK
jgi:hypothetical protein